LIPLELEPTVKVEIPDEFAIKESPLSKVIEKFRRNKQAKTALGHQILSSDLIGIINQTLNRLDLSNR
jgi:hypothetical protein